MTDDQLNARFDRLESMLASLIEREQVREWYTLPEFARQIGRQEETCREYLRRGRLHANKRMVEVAEPSGWWRMRNF
jgi:hypothetical protein